MRWLFLFVLSLNLAYIGWNLGDSSTGSYEHVPALKNVQTIMLISELDQQETKVAESNLKENIEAATSVDLTAEVVQTSNVVSEKIAEVQTKQESIAESVNVKTPAKKIIPKQLAVAKAEIKPVQNEPLESVQDARCFTLGPFRDLGKLRSLIREIKTYVEAADFRGREEKEQTLYWVYLKPEKNQAKAIATGKRLKAKKIKDFYVIREGDKINGLSLGHFRNKNGAYGLAKKVRGLGFNVIVEPVFRTYTIYWLDYQLAAGVKIPDSIFDKQMKSAGKDKISRLSRDCGG